jgi:hypothetical protein
MPRVANRSAEDNAYALAIALVEVGTRFDEVVRGGFEIQVSDGGVALWRKELHEFGVVVNGDDEDGGIDDAAWEIRCGIRGENGLKGRLGEAEAEQTLEKLIPLSVACFLPSECEPSAAKDGENGKHGGEEFSMKSQHGCPCAKEQK